MQTANAYIINAHIVHSFVSGLRMHSNDSGINSGKFVFASSLVLACSDISICKTY